MEFGIRRAYEPPGKDEGFRILVDRLWPRGLRKDELEFDLWAKELAPTPELRRWFAHSPQRWKSFQEKYARELDAPELRERMKTIADQAGERRITLLYGARDPDHNHALILAEAFRKL